MEFIENKKVAFDIDTFEALLGAEDINSKGIVYSAADDGSDDYYDCGMWEDHIRNYRHYVEQYEYLKLVPFESGTGYYIILY